MVALEIFLLFRVFTFLGCVYQMREMAFAVQTSSTPIRVEFMWEPGNIDPAGYCYNGEIPDPYVHSWNKDLAKQRANAMASEFRTKGVNVALGPVVGPLGRMTEGGRNWEGNISSFHKQCFATCQHQQDFLMILTSVAPLVRKRYKDFKKGEL